MNKLREDNEYLYDKNRRLKKEEVDMKIDFEMYQKMRDNLIKKRDEIQVILALSGQKLGQEDLARIDSLVHAQTELEVALKRVDELEA